VQERLFSAMRNQKWVRQILLLFVFLATDSYSACAARSIHVVLGEPKLSVTEQAMNQLNQLSLADKIGQLFIIAPDREFSGSPGSGIIPQPGGYILFSRHVPSLPATVDLVDKLRASATITPFIAVDQEGGRVARLSFTTPLPAARVLEKLPDENLVRLGRLLGKELYQLGFNVDFAPVLDVATRAENPVIGNRAFSADPYAVAKLAPAFIHGLQSAGIAATGKHFPGHGDTRSDSHLTLPVVDHALERIHSVELLPFYAAIQANVAMIMIGHLHYPALDSTPGLPATLSRPIIQDLLRKQLGYDGVIITDAMNMRAVTDGFESGPAAVLAFKAGVDIILMPQNFSAAYQAVLSAVESGEISISRLNESVLRILRLKQRLAAYKPNPVFPINRIDPINIGSPAHREWQSVLLQNRLSRVAETKNAE
jgi:beta-N-acetylhexosaminidase